LVGLVLVVPWLLLACGLYLVVGDRDGRLVVVVLGCV
jgi:hypothetical protein